MGRHEDPEYVDSTGLRTRLSIYDYRVSGPPFRSWVYSQLRIPPRATILDVGSGPGGMWIGPGARHGSDWRIQLLDRSPGMLADAVASGIRGWPILGDAESLPLPDGCMNAVTAFHMLYDVNDITRAVAEFRRVLTPGGTFHATTNGLKHMIELKEALGQAGVRSDFVTNPARMRFGLENGAEILGRSFDEVEVRTQRGALMVPDAGPLIAYAMTIERVADQLDPDRLFEFESVVRERVAAEGAFRLSTESCLFLAR